MHTPAVVSYC